MSDIILISKVGLYETVKCAICENPIKSERGCDGSCQYDKELHEKIVEAVEGIAEQRPHGEWLECEDKRYCECSNCWVVVTKKEAEDFGYCPKCGSDNRKKEDEPLW